MSIAAPARARPYHAASPEREKRAARARRIRVAISKTATIAAAFTART